MSEFRFEKVFTAAEAHSGSRVDKYISENSLLELGEEISRSRVLDLIHQSLIQINGKVPKPSYKVQVGDQVRIRLPKLSPSHLIPYDIDLDILFEDDDCIVINKPSGLVVHPAAGHEQDTLVNALLGKVRNMTVGIVENRPGIVHRLDKDTSGILVVAKNDQALVNLAKQFKEKTVTRHYYALVFGSVAAPKGTIQTYLSRHPNQRKKFASSEQGKLAITHFEKMGFSRGISLLRCRLETGRTHQIRVHLSEKGHAIIGDPIYSTNKPLRNLSGEIKELISTMNGIGLHAYELGFHHPKTGSYMSFKAPWPINLKPLIEELKFSDI